MTSWFSSAGLDLNSALDTLTTTVQSVTESVSEAIPTEHKEFLAKITLNTDEMISERQTFSEEATKKAKAKDLLNKILPWETLDAEREILVDECKEAILELSGREETFFGPYEMPLLKVMLKPTKEENNEEEGAEEEGDESEAPPAEDVTAKARQHMVPSEESLEMLRKLEPLPALLEDFDLDAHVGLIQRVMKEDPKLVAMQANFSGGGLREKIFWRNYFFHCAFARYEAGLSLDEIWSYREEQPSAVEQAETTPTEGIENHTEAENDAENIVEVSAEASTDAPLDLGDAAGTNENATERSELSPTNGFELLDDADVAVETNPELDELEAEIARELADM